MSTTPVAASSQSQYKVKWIYSAGVWLPFCMQNKNGPCPILAIANALLLRGNIQLPKGTADVTDALLQDALTDYLRTVNQPPNDISEELAANQKINFEDTISILPTLNRGIDVNVRFTAPHAFEFTREIACFDLFRLKLLHGWLVDPVAESELHNVIGSKSFNQILDLLVQADQNIPEAPTSSTARSPAHDAALIQTYLTDNASQLTYHGLAQLHSAMSNGEIAVFFRNNHFSTLHKRDDNLFILVSDQGYLNETSIVWDRLDGVTGESTFVDASFKEYHPGKSRPGILVDADIEKSLEYEKKHRSPKTPVDADEALARRLQDQEVERVSDARRRAASATARKPPPSRSKYENCSVQ